MPLTGAAVVIGETAGFGVSEDAPRSIAGFDGHLWVVGNLNRLIKITDLANGTGEFASTAVDTITAINGLTGHNDEYIYGYHDTQLLRIQPVDGDATPVFSTVGSALTGITKIRCLASDGTDLYAIDQSSSAVRLIRITLTPSVGVVAAGSITFPSSLSVGNVTGLFWYKNAWHLLAIGTYLFRLDADGSNWTAVRLGTHSNFNVGESIPRGGTVLNGTAYMVGNALDKIMRLVDSNRAPTTVGTIPAQTVNVGGDDQDVDVSSYFSDPDGDSLIYTVTEGDAAIATASVSGDVVTISPVAIGSTTVTVTASDGYLTAQQTINVTVANQPPVRQGTIPAVSFNVGDDDEEVDVESYFSDPNNDTLTYTAVSDDLSVATVSVSDAIVTISPGAAGTATVTVTAEDTEGATVTQTIAVTVSAQAPGRPTGLTSETSPEGRVTLTWEAPAFDGGSTITGYTISQTGDASASYRTTDTTFKTPKLADGEYRFTVAAINAIGTGAATSAETASVIQQVPQIIRPAIRVEIEGVDVSDRLTRAESGRLDPITIGKSVARRDLITYLSNGLQFTLDNADGDFDYSTPNNFFVTHSKPAHGRGASVLVRLGLSTDDLLPVFAGQVSEVQTSLRDTKALIKVRDISVKLRQNEVQNFGETLTRKITDFDGAAADYDDLDPIFYFPRWGLPIARGSVSVTVHRGGTDIPITIVDTVVFSGALSNTRAEIDYGRGIIRFEAPPDDGADTQITVTWKVDYKYKRPDYLIRQLLKHSGLQSELGITDDTAARFGIEQALVSHPSSEHFSSHGRPYPQKNGVVRWLRQQGTKWQMTQDTRFLEYDKAQDEYTEVSELPEEDIQGVDNTGYGEIIDDESFVFMDENSTAYTPVGLAIDDENRRIYTISHHGSMRNRIRPYLFDGTLVTSGVYSLAYQLSNLNNLAFYNDKLYAANARNPDRIRLFNISDGSEDSTITIGNWVELHSIAVTSTRIFLVGIAGGRNLSSAIYDHSGTGKSTEINTLRRALGNANPNHIAANDTHIFAIMSYASSNATVRATTLSYVRDPASDLTGVYTTIQSGFAASNTRFYSTGPGASDNLITRKLGEQVSFGGYVPFQFSTADNDTFYFICANNTQGNAVSASTLRRIKVYKYVRSTNVWTDLLNATTGQPQLSQAYKIAGTVYFLANNRKNFQVIQNSSDETLIFYRRVQATASGIAYYNDDDDTVTNVNSFAHSGSTDYYYPYSMDFALDSRSDGIYVYTFVVRVTFDGSGNYNGGWLRIYRERVEPSGTETQIYTETFSASSGEEDYPVSVSDLILDEDRDKFYFTLEYHNEGDGNGKAELCRINKDGTGSRAVLKTYDNPLLSTRSPALRNGSVYYLEGGWVRQAKDDPLDATIPDDQHHYPNESGRLIEINASDSVVDHGQIWRSATKADSPDPEDEINDGWGLFNAPISNIVVDDRGNLHFVAGFGSPYNVDENLPFSSNKEPVPDLSNFHRLQWGKDLATKIASFPTGGIKVWDLVQRLGQILNWEIGFGPSKRKVDAIQTAHPSITDWGANGSFFLRPRTILPAHLRNPMGASGTISTLALSDMGLPAEQTEFPVPPSGERYTVIIDKEIFSYTGVTPDSQGRVLSGVQRAQNGSSAAAHAANANVYFVDYFASGEQGTTLVLIASRSQDFVNLRNDVNIGYGAANYPAQNQQSIGDNGKFTFSLQNTLLSRFDGVWAELIGDAYLDELSSIKEVLQFVLVFSPALEAGQLIVVYQLKRLKIEFKLFRVLNVQHHIPRWQTGVTALEVV